MNSTRDFIDVQDVVEAYLSILGLDRGEKFTFNVCTGRGHTIGEVVHEVLRQLGSRREVLFQGRPNSSDDNPVLVGDPSRLAAAGWTARLSLAQSLSSMLAHTHSEP
jgi:GDP-4-dehydro-6-deoxy-D-mannose reductase